MIPVDVEALIAESSEEVRKLLSKWTHQNVEVTHEGTQELNEKALRQALAKIRWDVGAYTEIYDNNFKGLALGLVNKIDAAKIVDFIAQTPGRTTNLGDKEKSAVKETLNLVSGTYTNMFVKNLGIQLNLSPPEWIESSWKDVIVEKFHKRYKEKEKHILTKVSFIIEKNEDVRITMLLLFNKLLKIEQS